MPFKWKPGAKPRTKIDPEIMREAVKNIMEEGKSIRSVAKNFNIDRKTLGRYYTCIIQGKETSFEPNCNTSQIFSIDEESDLEEYLILASKLNYGLYPKEMREFAYQYACARKIKIPDNWVKNNASSYDWEKGFMHRHPKLSLRNPQATSLARGTAFNKTTVEEFFNNVKIVFQNGSYGPESIYNLDETGLTTVHRPGKIIAQKGEKQVSKLTSAERGSLETVCCAVSAVGNAVPPFFVFPRKRLGEPMTLGAPPGSVAAGSLSGWMTAECFAKY